MAGNKFKFTDNLLKVYNYAFTEETTYGFYKPNEAMYVGLRMTEKQYNCPGCHKVFTVKIRNDNDGILYFSKGRIAQQKKMATRRGLEPLTSAVTGRHSNQLNYRAGCLTSYLRDNN